MSIADRITSMSNNLSSAYDGIEYLGVDTSSIDKNLQNLSSILNVVYEGLPKVSDEGVSPSIVGSRVGRLKSTLKASDTTQFTTTGKNLFNVSDSSFNWGTLTFAVTNNIIRVNIGDGNGGIAQNSQGNYTNYNFDTSKDYYFSIYPKSGDLTFRESATYKWFRVCLYIKYSDDTTSVAYVNIVTNMSQQSVKVTFTEGKTPVAFAIGRYSPSNTLNTNQTAEYYIQLEQGSTATSYEPYTGGIPSPNPGFPQNIHVVKGNNILYIYGKNILPTQEKEWEQGTISIQNGAENQSTTRLRTKKYIPISQGAYYLSMVNNSYCFLNMHFYDENKTWLQGTYPLDGQTTKELSSIPANAKFFRMVIRDSSGSTTILPSEITSIKAMVEKGTTQSTFETNNVVTLSLGNIELCKIGDYQDKLFKAISGDIIYDSLTAEQKEDLVSGGWYKYGEIGKVVLDGVNTKFSQKSASTANVIWMTTADYDISTYNTNIICNYFKKATSSVIYNNSMLGVYTENNRIKCGFGIDTQLTTLELANEWLKTHNVIVYLPYGEPQIIPITDTTLISQLENLYSAMSKNGQTNILQTNTDNPFVIYASALKGE